MIVAYRGRQRGWGAIDWGLSGCAVLCLRCAFEGAYNFAVLALEKEQTRD